MCYYKLLHSPVWAIVWLMLSSLFLAKPTGFLFYINVFCGSRAEVVLRPIFVTWLCWACVRTRGLISLKFSRPGLVYTEFCGSRAEVVLRQILLPDSVEGVLEPGINFAEIFTPWSSSHCVLWLQSRSRFTAILVTWLCRACVRTRGLISIRPGLVYNLFWELWLLQKSFPKEFLLPVPVERFI